ncbi:MAG: V-type ATP synthase subunit D [Clostridia bacterium]|nr:V-type ATP synthase subunit D [Clostridia bacterium]
MASIKLTKNELKKQKDDLKQFERYLPTLQLKKQQLQLVIMQVDEELEQKNQEYAAMVNGLDDWVAVFSENSLFAESQKIETLVKPDKVICTDNNIAGVIVPVFRELTFKDISYDVADYPLWVDEALVRMREIAKLRVLRQTLKKQSDLLNRELRLTSQRVNLFEKVKIPETKENIRVIEIYLGDQQTSAVVRGKIAKKKRQVAAV